jgi:transposase
MEGRLRRSFADDYKRQAVDLVAYERSLDRVGAQRTRLRDSVLRRWVERRGAGREATAASRRPTTQAALPSADHAAEIACLQREDERREDCLDDFVRKLHGRCRTSRRERVCRPARSLV